METQEYIKDRNEAFSSMNKDKILNYCKKYNIKVPEDEEIFWIGVHKTICNLFLSTDCITLEQFNNSYDWLQKRGYTPSINLNKK